MNTNLNSRIGATQAGAPADLFKRRSLFSAAGLAGAATLGLTQAGCATTAATAATAGGQPHAATGSVAGTLFGENFISGPYERVFLKPGQERQYIRNYIDLFGGKVEYVFRLAEYFNLLVVGLQSPLGLVSLVVIEPENFAKLPGFIRETQIMFVVDSIDAVYRKAERNGVPILQKRTPNIMGAQGRLELAPGYIVELAEATNPSLFNPDLSSLQLPPARTLK